MFSCVCVLHVFWFCCHRIFTFVCVCVFAAGHQKQVGPELFRVFYTIWKETEAEAQEVCTCIYVFLLNYSIMAQTYNIYQILVINIVRHLSLVKM